MEAIYTNAIGSAAMQAYWQDPEFDPTQRAFYYVRKVGGNVIGPSRMTNTK